MAEQWIKITHVTPDKPEVFQIAEELDIDPDAVLGKLVRAWIWADQQTLAGDAPSVTKALLNRITAQPKFAEALIDAGWLAQGDQGLEFTNFERHNGKTAKKRALSNRRQSEHRENKRKSNANVTQGVTQSALRTRRPDEDEDEELLPTTNLLDTTGPDGMPIDPCWEPSKETMDSLFTLHGVDPMFAEQQAAEFRLYWMDRGECKHSWDSAFLKSCASQWQRKRQDWMTGHG